MPAAVKQASKFGLVGIFNTVLDFGIFNLAHSAFGASPFVSNIISTTIAMAISFMINRRYVFGGGERHAAHQAVAFLVVTAIGVYVIQSGIIYLTTSFVFHSDSVLASNVGKLIGTIFSLIWNFVLYKRVVFV